MAEAEFSPRAEQDLEDIWFAIAADNVTAADGVIGRIVAKATLAAGQPGMGAPRPELGRSCHDLRTPPGGILILAIVHGMREPGTWL